MNFHDKRVHTAFLILTFFLIPISYRIISIRNFVLYHQLYVVFY